MIRWSNPGALAALVLLAGPILVHLLLRHRAPRVPFPSVRFLQASRPAAVRLRLPSDAALLAIRLAIVAAAACALAQPLIVTRARTGAWAARMARAVVLDVSESMKPLQSVAAETVRAEIASASFSYEVADQNLHWGLLRAADALAAAPPARREIVVVSDFQWGTLRSSDVQVIPRDIGVRFIPVGSASANRRNATVTVFRPHASERQAFVLTPEGTGFPFPAERLAGDGLVILAPPADTTAVEVLQRVVANAGSPAPSPDQPLTIILPGSGLSAMPERVRAGWMLATVLRLKTDSELADACAGADATGSSRADGPWQVIFRDRGNRPIVSAAATGRSLLLDVAAPPSALATAAVVHGALSARQGSTAQPEDDNHRMAAAELTALTRPPSALDMSGPSRGLPSDARWLWLIVLALLGVEAIVRREHQSQTAKIRANAA